MIPLLAFYIYLAWKQAKANDSLIAQLEADPALAKTHHRKAWPFKPGWSEGSARLAVSAASGVSCGDHRDHHFDDLVDHVECASGRAGES